MEGELDSSKFYKVSYSLNMLSVIGEYIIIDSDGQKRYENKGINLIEACYEGEELDVFECQSIQNLISFKWD